MKSDTVLDPHFLPVSISDTLWKFVIIWIALKTLGAPLWEYIFMFGICILWLAVEIARKIIEKRCEPLWYKMGKE